MKKNITPVVANRVCTGCGGCSGVCPQDCIKTTLDATRGFYVTSVDENRCISCGLCQKVCPVYTWNNQSGNRLLGQDGRAFSAYACDEDLRYSCASGGFTTSLLCYLLEQGIADAVVAVGREAEHPLLAQPCICTSIAEVMARKGSVYAPTSYGQVFEALLQSPYEKVAVVGLPCHIQALSKLEAILPKLKSKIVMKISLVCGHTPSLTGYAYLLRHLQIDETQVKSLNNRGDGWPGYLKIGVADREAVKIKHGHWLSWGIVLSSPLFTPDGCAHCVDSTGYEADISVSDAWLPKFRKDHIGRNLIYVRSNQALDVILRMQAEGKLMLAEETPAEFVEANDRVFKEKLIINGVRNKRLQKDGLFAAMRFVDNASWLGKCGVRGFIVAESCYKRLLGTKGINRGVLFVYKTIKYLSLKWLRISC